MFKKLFPKLVFAGIIVFTPAVCSALSNDDISHYTSDTLSVLIVLASIACVFFLIRGAYLYITSSGKPAALYEAKKTIKGALIGLVIVLGASILSTLLNNAMSQPNSSGLEAAINLSPMQPEPSDNSLTQVLLDAISGFLKNIIYTATKPVIDGVTWFLTTTPTLSNNSVIFNFWLVIVGITDSLFVLVIALLGFKVMSTTTFGFEELTLKEVLPKIAIAFVLANTSIFIIDWVVQLCQVMVNAVLNATGGIGEAWILNAFDPATILSGTTSIITLIFMIIFIVLAVILFLFYISRLMILAFGVAISPLVSLLWLVPKMSDFAENCVNIYLVNIFILFVHVVIIQLASAFFAIPNQTGNANPIISILIGVAMLSVLLKSTATGVQLAISNQATGSAKKVVTQLINVVGSSSSGSSSGSSGAGSSTRRTS